MSMNLNFLLNNNSKLSIFLTPTWVSEMICSYIDNKEIKYKSLTSKEDIDKAVAQYLSYIKNDMLSGPVGSLEEFFYSKDSYDEHYNYVMDNKDNIIEVYIS